MKFLNFCLVILAVLVGPGSCARILAVMPTLSHSHHLWNRVLVNALADRGHDVIVVTPDLDKDRKNVHYINLEDTYETFHANFSLTDWATFSPKQNVDGIFIDRVNICHHQFQTKGFQEMLALKETIDLILIDVIVNECFFGVQYYFGAPVVAVSAYGYSSWNCEQMGVHDPMAVYPQPYLPFSTKMTFRQRFNNVLLTSYILYIRNYEYLPKNDEAARSVFGSKMPPLSEIERNFSLFLVNSGPEIDPPRAHPPSVIEVGCLHCQPGKTLPKDIQEYLDGAKDGAIFFSLGSNVRSDEMPKETLQAFLNAFSKLKQRVLWKWESDTLPGQPDNVKLGKWLPQQDILAHPNVRLFITHGGRLSTQESVYHGVPVLCIPVFMDQYVNSQRAVYMGMGLSLGLAEVTEPALNDHLEKLLSNESFLASARVQSQVSRDQPETPLERAVFWTEYVLRHKGAPHLRSTALDLAWYQLYLLDVVAAILVPLVLIVLAVLAVCKRCVRTKQKPNVDDKKTR